MILRTLLAIFTPVLLYVLALRLCGVRKAAPLPGFLFALAGMSFILVYDCIHELVIALLSLGCVLSMAASVLTYRRCKSVIVSVLLLALSVFGLPLLFLGYNPYAVVTADHVRVLDGHKGLYQIKINGFKGLRDRWGVVLNAVNRELHFLDGSNEYLAVKGKYPGDYGVFALSDRFFIVNQSCGIDSIVPIDSMNFKMIDSDGRYFATFTLPESPNGAVEFRGRYSDAVTPLDTFLVQARTAQDIDPDDDYYWQEMKRECPQAYSLLSKILAMAGEECSPANDLAFAQAFTTIVKEDPYYKGDSGKALKDLEGAIDILSAGNQPSLNEWAALNRLLSSLRLSLDYEGYVALGDLYRKEYVAWHNLLEAIVSYSDYISYNSDWYSSKLMDIEAEKQGWLDKRRTMLDVEKKIVAGRGTYGAKDLKPERDDEKQYTYMEALDAMSGYHSDTAPSYYHPMWYEIKPAFEAWLDARGEISASLPESKRADYDATTASLETMFANMVVRLDSSSFAPAL